MCWLSVLVTLSGQPLVSITGAAAGDFSVITQPGASIEAGESASLSIRFTPGASGLRGARVSIASDAASSPYSFALQGTGEMQDYMVVMPMVVR